MRTVLVTGSSGFIGFFTCTRLLADGFKVIGVDCLTDYYDVSLKKHRETILSQNVNFTTIKEKIETPGFLLNLFTEVKPDIVIHLAAQAGVRHSIENPRAYLEGNINGTFELLEAARAHPPKHMLLASTSSAFGANTAMPYKETDKADFQVSFYAATKKATENMAHSYAHLFHLPITMFRFFTVYGPWGRPDMAPFKFTKSIISGEAIDVYNYGNMERDFTYVTDLVQAIRLLIEVIPKKTDVELAFKNDSLSPVAPWRVVNVGNSEPVKLDTFIKAIEQAVGKKAVRNLLPMQAGDVPATWADASLLKALTNYVPRTNIYDGIKDFVEWYKNYYT